MASPARTVAATESGCLAIADISGYTGYLVGAPLEFTEDVVADVTETIAARLGQVFRVNKREGDAVFCYALREDADGSLILDAVEECYFAFRSRLEGVANSTTCSCAACRRATQLDLKVILHAGDWIRRGDELTGGDVIVAHRLLKNGVELSGYLLMTEAFAAAYALNPEHLGFAERAESYADVGEVRAYVSDLEQRYLNERERRRLAVTAEQAAFVVERMLPMAPPKAWELLTAAEKRLLWQVDDIEEAQAGGRRCTGTASICVDGRTKIYEEIVDWRPFEYFTEVRRPDAGSAFLLTTSLTPTARGTAVRLFGRPRDGRAAWRETRRLVRRLRANYDRLAQLAGEGKE